MRSAAPTTPETQNEPVIAVAAAAVEVAITWTQAKRDLGITLSRDRQSKYRDWLGMNKGEKLSPVNKERFRLMYAFCHAGSGPEFSMARFRELELSGELEQRLQELGIQ